jgi:hypothetical protein
MGAPDKADLVEPTFAVTGHFILHAPLHANPVPKVNIALDVQ